jgi:hypothetical protein
MDKSRWFIEKMLEACQAALEDGRIGTQCNHVEKIEVTNPDLLELKVSCFGDYSPEKSTEEHEKQGVFDVMHIVAGYLASRAVKRIEGFEGLVKQIH